MLSTFAVDRLDTFELTQANVCRLLWMHREEELGGLPLSKLRARATKCGLRLPPSSNQAAIASAAAGSTQQEQDEAPREDVIVQWRMLRVTGGHSAALTAVDWSPDGTRLAVGSDSQVRRRRRLLVL
jgi:hypothetical protein